MNSPGFDASLAGSGSRSVSPAASGSENSSSSQQSAGTHQKEGENPGEQLISVEVIEREFLRLTHLQFVASKVLVEIVSSVDADLGEHGLDALQVRGKWKKSSLCDSETRF